MLMFCLSQHSTHAVFEGNCFSQELEQEHKFIVTWVVVESHLGDLREYVCFLNYLMCKPSLSKAH